LAVSASFTLFDVVGSDGVDGAWVCGAGASDAGIRYWPTMKTTAIRTAARMARFSVLKARRASGAADPSRPDERGGIAATVPRRATAHGRRRARRGRAARTRSSSGQTDSLAEAGATRCAGKREERPGPGESEWSRARARDGGERLAHLALQRLERRRERGRPADDHERSACRGGHARRPKRLTQTPPRAIALYGVAQLSAHGEPHARRLAGFAPENDERRTVDAFAPLEERLKIGASGQSLSSGEPAGQTVSRFRPFARRRFNTFRPPFVFMRSRNPCVLARRRRLG